MTSYGEYIVEFLDRHGVSVVFGIPGVHTIELYRGLSASSIRHVTPRHEQGIGFMADGYARVSGKPGVGFVITGPGLTNMATPMAQARNDSIPMLVISSVNDRPDLGKQLGHLHELPDQHAFAATIALKSHHVTDESHLPHALAHGLTSHKTARPGPIHIEVPLDLMGANVSDTLSIPETIKVDHKEAEPAPIDDVAKALQSAKRPVLLTGGGAKSAEALIQNLAEKLDAPVIQTTNARGMLYQHPLCVPASPSLKSVRALIAQSDCVIALGTEMGSTDYDMYRDGAFPKIEMLIRFDICENQLHRIPTKHTVVGDLQVSLPPLLEALSDYQNTSNLGAKTAKQVTQDALAELPERYRDLITLMEIFRDMIPNSIMVGDSTQFCYAGNMVYAHDRVGGYFNAATGFGALGYGIPASIGAALADPASPVICLLGDGGAQFTLSELMTAKDEKCNILFVVWNNAAFQEIADAMHDVNIDVVGCDPTPPDFEAIAKACDMPYHCITSEPDALKQALETMGTDATGPRMLEIDVR